MYIIDFLKMDQKRTCVSEIGRHQKTGRSIMVDTSERPTGHKGELYIRKVLWGKIVVDSEPYTQYKHKRMSPVRVILLQKIVLWLWLPFSGQKYEMPQPFLNGKHYCTY